MIYIHEKNLNIYLYFLYKEMLMHLNVNTDCVQKITNSGIKKSKNAHWQVSLRKHSCY